MDSLATEMLKEQISMGMNLSTATISRIIKQVKHKILKIL